MEEKVISFEAKAEEKVKLTEDQLDKINKELEEVVEEDANLKAISELPSNNQVEYHVPEKGEQKKVMVRVNPESGEHAIVGNVEIEDETFDELVKRLDLKTDFDSSVEKEITSEEFSEAMNSTKSDENSLVKDVVRTVNYDLSDEALKIVIEVANRKLKKEEFNVYRELPKEVQTMIDKYCTSVGVPVLANEGKRFRKMVAEMLISEFIQIIITNRAQIDFNKEIETLFSKGTEEIAEMAIGYTSEKNAAMRKYAEEQMTDEDKKQKLLAVLDKFDEAYSLSTMKEYAKKCKIKKYDLERPDKIYRTFLQKYVNSTYNIWDIEIVRPILARYLNTEMEEFTEKDIDAFFICYCRQCASMKPEVAEEHAYMYNIIFNITLIDINKGKDKSISDIFVQNIREVIYNLRERNHNYI